MAQTPSDASAGGDLLVMLQPPPWPLSPQHVSPMVWIDDRAVPGSWGRNFYAVSPGRHTLIVHVRVPEDRRASELSVTVLPGQQLEVFYACPVVVGFRGRLGFRQQRHPGSATAVVSALTYGMLMIALILFLLG